MSKMDEYKHPQWQKKRLEVMERDNFRCIICGDGSETLHVHHKKYAKGKKIWECDVSNLQTLCESCHKDVEAFVNYARENGAILMLALERVLGIGKPNELLKLILDANAQYLDGKELAAAEIGISAFQKAFEYMDAG